MRKKSYRGEKECFDCEDWSRNGTVCPAHGVLRKESFVHFNETGGKDEIQ